MKILHVNFSDSDGGAAIAVKRLHDKLLEHNYDSKIFVHEKLTNDSNVIHPKSSFVKIRSIIYDLINRRINKFNKKNNFSTKSLCIFPTNTHKLINKLNPDVVNLHWIGNSMISIKEISKIKAPIIWTMHDMWPFCCTEHLTSDNNYLNINFSNSKLSLIEKFVWAQKKKYFSKIDFKIICTSNWIFNAISESFLFKKKRAKIIPLILNKSSNVNICEKVSRKILSISTNKYIICNMSQNLNNPNKNLDGLIKCIDENPFFHKENTEVLLIGTYKEELKSKKNIKINYLGNINDEISKNIILSSIDVMALSSKIETFGQSCLEALSKGIPCVVFNNHGSSDLIKHKVNGYIAQKDSFKDFSIGLVWVLEKLREKKDKIKNEFESSYDEKKIIDEYINFIKF